MPTEPTRAPVNPLEASDGRRLHIHGIKEMPAGYDAEVAELFRDLRAASNLSEADLAATLATRTEVVQALEQGALYALPPWPETSRVVNSYGLLLNLDVRPLLRRIYAQVEPSSTGQDSYAAVESRPEPQAAPPRSPLDIPFESDQRQPQAHPEPQRAPQQNWAPQPQDRRMQPRAPGAPMPGRLGPQAPQMSSPPQRPPQANPMQGRPPQQPQPQARPHPVPPQARAPQAPPPRPQISQASAPTAKPVEAKPAPDNRKSRRGRAVKWGLAAVVLIVAVTGFFALRSDPGLIGFSNSSQSGGKADKPTDSDDPRSHKADRLPSPNGL
jgi:hypothetical protein